MNIDSFPNTLQQRIIDKIRTNKLTIIVGPTGCGKSSIIPQILLNTLGPSILCTQPRRLAVVAVASHVASQRSCVLGEEVGYHVGQENVSSDTTGLLFVTAGILLEELKLRRVDALQKYKVCIIDECHERSCESDLCLTIIREMMGAYPRSKLRLVLMSATFDHARYANFFRGVSGCEYIDTITIQSTGNGSMGAYHDQVQTLYLEDINRLYQERRFARGMIDSARYISSVRADAIRELKGDDDGRTLSEELLKTIRCLVEFLDRDEEEDKVILIFAPTYRHLEQIYYEIDGLGDYEIDVLHSSIDLEDCLKSMSETDWHGLASRKVLLASAIADSSVTIPNVSCVIDTCRALEVKWNTDTSAYQPKTVYCSQAICDQRKGRTGRTCAGRVFRLVPKNWFLDGMELYEQAQLQIASCRTEILALLSSHNKVMKDPRRVLAKSMDPPPETTVLKAIEYLKDIHACEEVVSRHGKKLIPTDHGRLIAALPFTVEEAGVVINGAKKGYLHEALLVTAIKSIRPQPIVNTIGGVDQVNISLYYPEVETRDPKSIVVAHFAAFIYWYKHWNKIRREAMADHFELCSSGIDSIGTASPLFGECSAAHNLARDCKVAMWSDEMDEAHSEWCREHFINPSSVKAINQCIDVVMKILYRADFEPEWLKCQPLEPAWNRYTRMPRSTYDTFASVYGEERGREITEVLIRIQENSIQDRRDRKDPKKNEMACIHFLRGSCSFGEDCHNAHSFDAPRPVCIFKSRPSGCTNPNCLFSHDDEEPVDEEDAMVPAIHGRYDAGALGWYRENSSSLLLLGNCNFIHALEGLNHPPAVSWGEDASRVHINSTLANLHSRIFKCAWNFPSLGEVTPDDSNTILVRGYFMSAAALFKSRQYTQSILELAVTLQADEFCKWNVLQAAQYAGFSLEWTSQFDCSAFPGYKPSYPCGANRTIKNARFYVFRTKRERSEQHDVEARNVLLHRHFSQY
ncbi:hypothetical protein ACHAXN_007352 [Cyclotella atomus]